MFRSWIHWQKHSTKIEKEIEWMRIVTCFNMILIIPNVNRFPKKLQVHFAKILTQVWMVPSQVLIFFINLQCYEDDQSSKPCFTSCCSIVSAQSYLRNVCILGWESTLYQKLLNQYPWVKLVCFMNKIITKAKLFMFNSKLWSCMEVPQCWSKH